MKWIDLFKFLNERANDIKNLGSFNWQAPVTIHDAETGDEFSCDTYYINDIKGNDRLVLITNVEKVFEENI
jgi:hypothetical protein